jgi:hypothetical protein
LVEDDSYKKNCKKCVSRYGIKKREVGNVMYVDVLQLSVSVRNMILVTVEDMIHAVDSVG